MKKNKVLVRLFAVLMVWMMIAPSCAAAEAPVQVSEAVKAACVQAGGEVLSAPLAVKVISPYGTQSVVLRDAPSNSYGAVAMLTVGQQITVVGTNGEFSFVLLEDGSTGWLASSEVK